MRKVISLIVISALSFIPTVPAQAEPVISVSKADAELIDFIEDSGKRAPVGVDERGRAWVLANTLMVPEPVGETGLYATTLKTSKALEAVAALSDSSIVPNFMVHLNEPIVVESAVRPTSVLGVNPVTKIAANEVHTDGNTGENVAVAIIDTGIDPDHPYFKDAQDNSRIVAEACFVGIGFSAASATDNFPCLNGSNQQIGIGASDITNHVASGAPNDRANQSSSFNSTGTSQADWASIMDHGTHVAGLAAGSSNTLASIPDSAPGGVAPDADIISIRVFGYDAGWYWDSDSQYWLFSTGGAHYLDILAAVDWVTETSDTYNTVALNLSLGGGEYSAACDGDISNNFTDARFAGVAPLVAAGNDSFANAISWPACASSAIAVGASTGDDQIAGFSNSGVMLDIAAPGADVGSAVPRVNGDYSASAYERWYGTSMATPVAAGAVALIAAIRPDVSIDDIESALEDTGFLIDDVVIQDIPRINVDLAITELGGELVAQTISVTGSVSMSVYETIEVSASSSSNLSVSVVASGNSEACFFTTTNEGSTTIAEVTGIGAGSCTLYFNQSGGAGYAAAPEVTHVIEIERYDQTISIFGSTEANAATTVELFGFASSTLPLSFELRNSAGICTATSSDEDGMLTVVLNLSGVGTCTVRFTQPGDEIYKPADVYVHEVVVSKSTPSLIVSVPDSLTAGTSSTVSAFVDSGSVAVSTSTPSVCSVSGLNVSALTPGSCVLNFNVAESSTHISASEIRTIPISAAVVGTVRLLKPKVSTKSFSIRWKAPTNVAFSGLVEYEYRYRISYPGKKFTKWTTRTTTSRTFKVPRKGTKYRLEYEIRAIAPESVGTIVRGKLKNY
jgi:subtilisin family serine protease